MERFIVQDALRKLLSGCSFGRYGGGLLLIFISWSVSASEYDGYYNFIGTYPSNEQATYTEECQGVTTGGENWFFSRNQFMWLMKIPFYVDLHDTTSDPIRCDKEGVTCLNMSAQPELAQWNHVGDVSFYEYVDIQGEAHKFIIAPFEHTDNRPLPALGVFDAEGLQYLDHAILVEHAGGYASWVAVDPDGYLYSGRGSGKVGYVYKYSVDWERLVNDRVFSIQKQGEDFPLYYGNGELFDQGPAGGAISDSGRYLYISSSNGVDVFNMETHFQLRHIDDWKHENEGLTIFDVDALPLFDRPPNISGELHVVLLKNELSDDNIYMDHYTSRIFVDGSFGGTGAGTPDAPYQTLTEAVYSSWMGSQLVITGGQYNESVTISWRTKLALGEGSTGSVVIFGQP